MKLTQERLIEIIREEMEAFESTQKPQTTEQILEELDSLYTSLNEDLNETEPVYEADGPSKAMQWIWWGPKASKAQGKVNKIKLNTAALEFARDNAEDKDAKAKLAQKTIAAKEQQKQLQSMVDDKFSGKGEITKRYLASAKIKGQLEVIKKTTGMTDDPKKNKELKDQMKELSTKLKKEEEAKKELEPSPEEQQAEKERLEREKEQAKKDKKALADAQKGNNKETNPPGEEETTPPKKEDNPPGEEETDKGVGTTVPPKKEDTEEEEPEEKKKDKNESKTVEDYNKIMNETLNHSQSIRDRFSRLL